MANNRNHHVVNGLDVSDVRASDETRKLFNDMEVLITQLIDDLKGESDRISKSGSSSAPQWPWSSDAHFNDFQVMSWHVECYSASQQVYAEEQKIISQQLEDHFEINRLVSNLLPARNTSGNDFVKYILLDTESTLTKLNELRKVEGLDTAVRKVIHSMNRDVVVQLASKLRDELDTESQDMIRTNIRSALSILIESTKDEYIDPKHLQAVLHALKQLSQDLTQVKSKEDHDKISRAFSNFVFTQKASMIGYQLLYALKVVAAALYTAVTGGLKFNAAQQLFNSGKSQAKLHRDLTKALNNHPPSNHSDLKKRGRQ